MSSDLHYLTTPKRYLFDGCKLLWHKDRVKDFLDGKRIAPIHIDMGVHKSCNIKCVYCYGIKQQKSPEFIPSKNLVQLANDAKEVGVKSIAIIGDGEPTLNKGLYEFVQEGKRVGLDLSVATNGLLLEHGQIEMLTRSLVWLRFNVSGVSKYEQVMGAREGSFSRLEEIVKYAVEHKNKCTIGLQMVLIPNCFDQVVPLAKKAVEWGVDYLVVKQFSDGGAGMPMHFDMKSYGEARRVLLTAESLSNEKTKIIIKWRAMEDSKSITMGRNWGFDRCIDLPLLFQISGNGKCYPCGYMFGNPDFCYGDVTKQRLSEILKSERYWWVVEKAANTPLEELCTGQCRHCETLKFVDRLKKSYKGDIDEALATLCGGVEAYQELLDNPPDHINFI